MEHGLISLIIHVDSIIIMNLIFPPMPRGRADKSEHPQSEHIPNRHPKTPALFSPRSEVLTKVDKTKNTIRSGSTSAARGHKKGKRKVQGVPQSQKSKRKVQGVPQSQDTAFPRHQEKEETDTQASANRTNIRKALRVAPFSPDEVIAMLKGLKKHKNKITQGKTLNKSPRRKKSQNNIE